MDGQEIIFPSGGGYFYEVALIAIVDGCQVLCIAARACPCSIGAVHVVDELPVRVRVAGRASRIIKRQEVSFEG